MMTLQPSTIEIAGAVLFGLAVLHTFCTAYFERLAHARTAHAGLWRLLGEVETVFGFWAILLLGYMAFVVGWTPATAYLDERRFVEPLFVFVIMVIAASRPVMQLASDAVRLSAAAVPARAGVARYFLALTLVPLLGSFITEPAAMTLAALMLRDTIFQRDASARLKYATLGVLFVNVSIGGTLTNFAAPPVLMVAAKWEWTSMMLFTMLGWKAAVAVLINGIAVSLLFRHELAAKAEAAADHGKHARVPAIFVVVNAAILAAAVFAAHDPEVFMGLFLVFLGLAEAYRRHHDRLMLREGLMVGFFLAGLVVLGGQQAWWLQAALQGMSDTALFYGATALTAITDNAALTYLGSLVDGISEEAKYALVAGAVAGGGLTVIANAPNPAGFAILKDSFDDQAINPFSLLAAALPPTLVAVLCLRGLGGHVAEFFDLALWRAWFADLEPAFAFLLVLPLVVAAVGLWAEKRERDRQPPS